MVIHNPNSTPVPVPSYLLGLDVSTTGSKAVLIDETGRVVGSATHEHPLSTPRPAWSEQDPADWWSASVASIRRVLDASGVKPEEVVGVGMTGQMHGLVVQNPMRMGYLGVRTMVQHLQGQAVEERIDTGVTMITPENLSDPASQELVDPPVEQYLSGE